VSTSGNILGGLWTTGEGSLSLTGGSLTLAGNLAINGSASTGIYVDSTAGSVTIGSAVALSNTNGHTRVN
jgi:hypothetical protein